MLGRAQFYLPQCRLGEEAQGYQAGSQSGTDDYNAFAFNNPATAKARPIAGRGGWRSPPGLRALPAMGGARPKQAAHMSQIRWPFRGLAQTDRESPSLKFSH